MIYENFHLQHGSINKLLKLLNHSETMVLTSNIYQEAQGVPAFILQSRKLCHPLPTLLTGNNAWLLQTSSPSNNSWFLVDWKVGFVSIVGWKLRLDLIFIDFRNCPAEIKPKFITNSKFPKFWGEFFKGEFPMIREISNKQLNLKAAIDGKYDIL